MKMQKNHNRILIISPAPDGRGGVANVINILYSAPWPTDWRFSFLSSQNDRSTVRNLAALLLAVFSAPWKILNSDLVHIHSASYNSFRRKMLFMTMCIILHRKYLLHIHGGGFEKFINDSPAFLKKLYGAYIRRASGIITLSEPFADVINKITSGKNPLWTIPNPGAFPVTPKTTEHRDVCNILFAGWLTRAKGVFDLMEAFSLAKFAGNVKLVIVGKGDVDVLQDYAEKLGIAGNTEICGWQNRTEMISRYKNADIFVLPSYIEGMPMVLLEAMSFGIPIISTRVGGIPSMMPENAAKWLFVPGDLVSLGNLMQKMAFMPADERSKYGKSLQDFYAANYHSEKVLCRLDSCYKKLLHHN